MPNTALFHDVVRGRHSVRDFLPTPVSDEKIHFVLEDAQRSPSNCNTQPWDVHIVSGAKRDELSAAMVAAAAEGRFSTDYSFDINDYYDSYKERSAAQGAVYYEALGVKRDAYDERRTISERNLTFFGAPHVALLFVPSFGDNVRAAADVGMYGQTFLLSLVAHGLGGVPQTMLGMFADTVRDILRINSKSKFLFGISFGYPNPDSAANKFRMSRSALDQCVTFHS
jgi:nitroreductase